MFVASPAVGDLFVDGLNLACYVSSEPVLRTDPRGLFLGLPGQAALMGINAWGAASDSLETARMGIVMGFGLLESLAQYQLETTVDAAWATDWEYEDFDYFAGGITDASYGRMYTFSGAVHEPESGADEPAQAG